jgi:hypothetical protein
LGAVVPAGCPAFPPVLLKHSTTVYDRRLRKGVARRGQQDPGRSDRRSSDLKSEGHLYGRGTFEAQP